MDLNIIGDSLYGQILVRKRGIGQGTGDASGLSRQKQDI